MQTPGGIIVVNPAFQDWIYEDDKPNAVTPVKGQIPYRMQEEIGAKTTRDDPWQQSESRGSYDYGKAVTNHGSSRALLALVSLLCLLSIASVLLTLLMFFGKIGYKCGCTDEQLGKLTLLKTKIWT